MIALTPYYMHKVGGILSQMLAHLLSRRLGIGTEDSVKFFTLDAVLVSEGRSDGLELLVGLADEVVSPLLDEEFAEEDVARDTSDTLRELPNGGGVEDAVLLGDLLDDMVEEGLVDVTDVGVIGSPSIYSETVLLGKEILEEGHVRSVEVNVDHSLEANVLVQPDRPAETILKIN